MSTETINVISSLGGSFAISRTGEDKIPRQITVPAAQAGVVTSGTTDRLLTLGTAGMTALDVDNGDLVGVFWDDGCRYDMEVTAHDGTTLTVAAADGQGDAFPDNATVITVSKVTERADIAFAAAGLLQLIVTAPAKAGETYSVAVNFLSDVPASLLAVTSIGGEGFVWVSDNGVANPITGTVAALNLYSGSLTETVITVAAQLS